MKGATKMENRTMYYGKGDVFVYRTNVKPLTGLRKIPESNVTEINNIIFGWNIKVEVAGQQLFSSFSEGNNELVVATDSMKNFIHKHLAYFNGRTIEGFLAFVADRFLETYPQMDTIKLIGEEIPFLATKALKNGSPLESNLVFNHSRNEQSVATLFAKKNENDSLEVLNHSSGIQDLQLIKINGNSFAGFIRDEYTTLQEDYNRPLFIYLTISWNYENFKDSTGETPALYVCSEQVKDIVTTVFHKLDTLSIQHLIYQIGLNILVRFPQLTEVTFQSQNRTWETVVDTIPDSDGKVYTEPRPPYGFQGFTLTRDDLNQENSVDEEITQL
jgi:urate oxidase / 2-oxo-4-hydroxy-4-carboxy-5-ureidoimidazoline decarboxylase